MKDLGEPKGAQVDSSLFEFLYFVWFLLLLLNLNTLLKTPVF